MIICKHNNEYKIISESECIRTLYDELEAFAWTYVNKLQIVHQKFYRKSKSHKWGNVPMGYFAVMSPQKITIYRKSQLSGIIYNSLKVEKIISFIMIKPRKKIIAELPEQDPRECYPTEIEKVHEELLSKKINKSEN